MNKPQIVFFLPPFRKLDPNKLEHRRQLINSFVNAIILYEDRFTFVGNYKDGTKTVTFAELEAADLGSGFTASCVPKKRRLIASSFLVHRKKGLERAAPVRTLVQKVSGGHFSARGRVHGSLTAAGTAIGSDPFLPHLIIGERPSTAATP